MLNKFIPIANSGLFIHVYDKHYIRIKLKYSETHTIEPVFGTEVQLKSLKDNESVVAGDGKTYHFRLTLKTTA